MWFSCSRLRFSAAFFSALASLAFSTPGIPYIGVRAPFGTRSSAENGVPLYRLAACTWFRFVGFDCCWCFARHTHPSPLLSSPFREGGWRQGQGAGIRQFSAQARVQAEAYRRAMGWPFFLEMERDRQDIYTLRGIRITRSPRAKVLPPYRCHPRRERAVLGVPCRRPVRQRIAALRCNPPGLTLLGLQSPSLSGTLY